MEKARWIKKPLKIAAEAEKFKTPVIFCKLYSKISPEPVDELNPKVYGINAYNS